MKFMHIVGVARSQFAFECASQRAVGIPSVNEGVIQVRGSVLDVHTTEGEVNY